MRNGEISYWWQARANRQQRPPLPGGTQADVCVVGGGYTGLWTAYYLAEADPTLAVGGNVLVYNLTPALDPFEMLNGDVPIGGTVGLIGDLRFTDNHGDTTGDETCSSMGTVQCLMIFYVFDSEGNPADVGPISTSFLTTQTPGTVFGSNGWFTYTAGGDLFTYDGSIVPEPVPAVMLTFGLAAFFFIHKRSKAK